jgi:spore coat protein U-like protein
VPDWKFSVGLVKSRKYSKMTKYISRAAIAAAALALGVSGAYAAGTVTGNLAVTANLPASCTAVGGTLVFGDISAITDGSSNVDVPGTISVTCTSGTTYGLDFTGGTGTSRSLKGSGTHATAYNIYQEAAYTNKLGTDVNGVALSGLTSGTVTIYGRVLPNASAPVDAAYADNVTISVSY